MMISVNGNLQIVRVSAVYDLVVTAGFMTPWTASLVFKGFAALSGALALDRAVPTLDITAMLFRQSAGQRGGDLVDLAANSSEPQHWFI
ncbi:hypothetical protein [Pseudomonas syringae]|uniref:hypothetical protein n=1 Tax=Pseudomonas syringae TaxID=317 RepID=UPI0018A2185F|nr:hypothetical protein [Pseudomonas syringae]